MRCSKFSPNTAHAPCITLVCYFLFRRSTFSQLASLRVGGLHRSLWFLILQDQGFFFAPSPLFPFNLVPRVSLSPPPRARSWGRGERDPGNEVGFLSRAAISVHALKHSLTKFLKLTQVISSPKDTEAEYLICRGAFTVKHGYKLSPLAFVNLVTGLPG